MNNWLSTSQKLLIAYPVKEHVVISRHLFWTLFQERHPVNIRKDIGLSDQDLIVLPIKELNTMLRSNFCSRERANELKAERRRLKNRGYAAAGRKKLKDKLHGDEKEIKDMKENLRTLTNQCLKIMLDIRKQDKANDRIRSKIKVD